MPDLKKKKVAEHYNRISKYYDGFGFLKRLFEFRLYVEMLNYLKSGDAALDIACGTGNMSFELAKRFQRVHGLDISKGMLKRSKRKVYGGMEALKESIKQTYERYNPELIVVITTCPSDIIGDDVKAAIDEIKADIGCDVVFSTGCLCLGHSKTQNLGVIGAQDVLYAIVDQLLDENEDEKLKKSVNVAISSVHGAASEMSEMKGMLEKIGIKINGIYFDGTATTTVEDLKNMPRAELNIVDYPQA